MASKFSQVGTQVQTQQQTLTPQQLLVTQLVEMPVEALYERVDQELKENIALERDNSDDWNEGGNDWNDSANDWNDSADWNDNSATEWNDNSTEWNESVLDGLPVESSPSSPSDAFRNDQTADYSSPDDIPDNLPGSRLIPEAIVSETLSFYDQLEEQIGFLHIDDHEKELIRYLIGSLDDDGLLRTPLQQILDELEVYHNIDTSMAELEKILHILQTFEPAGVGARTLQECLLLQVQRSPDHASPIKQKLRRLIERHFDELMLNRWDRIQRSIQLTDGEVKRLQHEIRRLNPRPGSSMGEAIGRNLQQITPDFIIENDPYGNLTLTLNKGHVPPLRVSDDDLNLLRAYEQRDPKSLSRAEREGASYLRERVDRAQSFIDALRQRQRTLTITMQAIIRMQRPFFDSGDETLLRPMTLEAVSKETGLHLSTVSRVSNSKWVQTAFGIYPLRWFFTSAARQGGEDVSVRSIKAAIKELIEAEDKRHPLTDEALTEALQKRHFDVARRTVTKYRVQMGIPVARMRK